MSSTFHFHRVHTWPLGTVDVETTRHGVEKTEVELTLTRTVHTGGILRGKVRLNWGISFGHFGAWDLDTLLHVDDFHGDLKPSHGLLLDVSAGATADIRDILVKATRMALTLGARGAEALVDEGREDELGEA